MKKQEILNHLWEFLEIDGFSKRYWGKYEDEAKQNFFKIGINQTKKHLQTTYNLYCYGYYNDIKYKLYYDALNP